MSTSPTKRDTRERFEEQFTPAGDDFLYRRGGYGPGYRVSKDEHDAFLETFDHQYSRLLAWTFGAGFVVVITLLLAIKSISLGLGGVSYLTLWFSAAVALLAVFLVSFYRIDTTPRRALVSRMPVVPALSREQRRRLRLEETSWNQMVLPLSFMIINLLRMASQRTHDIEDGIYATLFVLIAVVLVWQCVQKWRLTRAG